MEATPSARQGLVQGENAGRDHPQSHPWVEPAEFLGSGPPEILEKNSLDPKSSRGGRLQRKNACEYKYQG